MELILSYHRHSTVTNKSQSRASSLLFLVIHLSTMVPPRRPETVMDAAATLASLVSKPSAASSTTSNVEGDPTAAMAVTNKREQQETSPRQINGKLLSPPICQQKSDGPDQLSIRSNDVLQTFSSTSDLKSSGRIKKAPKFPAKVRNAAAICLLCI